MGFIYRIMTDKLPRNVKLWTPDHVKLFLESKMVGSDYSQSDVNDIWTAGVTGNAFLHLTEENLTRKPGPFALAFSPAVWIIMLVEQLKMSSQNILNIDHTMGALNIQDDRMSISSSTRSEQSNTTRKDKTKVSLRQLFTGNYITSKVPLFYYRNSDAGPIYYACKVKNVDEKGNIFISPSIPGIDSLNGLHALEAWIVSEYNKKNNLRGNKKANTSNTSYQYFFVGTSISDLKSSYANV